MIDSKRHEEIVHQWELVWVDITVWGETIFVDRSPSLSDEQVRKLVAKIMDDSELSINNTWHVQTSEWIVLQIWQILDWNLTYTSSHTQISWDINPNGRMSALKDDGTIGKSNWRFELLQFWKKIFPEWILGNTGVVFMPWMWRDEFNLWKSFWVHSKNMTMIEWDDDKHIELRRKYQNNGSTPNYVHSYLWTGDEVFSKELVEVLRWKHVSVLSLDTESWFAPWLYKDLLWVFSNIEIGEDVLLMLNIVRRWSTKFSNTFARNKWDDIDIIDEAMKVLPTQLVVDSERKNISVVDVKTWRYLWWSATPMHFVFAHIKRI